MKKEARGEFLTGPRRAGPCGRLGFIGCFPLYPANPLPKICFLLKLQICCFLKLLSVDCPSQCGLPFSMASVGEMDHTYFWRGKPGSRSSRYGGRAPLAKFLSYERPLSLISLVIPLYRLAIRQKSPSH